MQAVQAELSPVVMDLAPPGMPANHQVTYERFFDIFFLKHKTHWVMQTEIKEQHHCLCAGSFPDSRRGPRMARGGLQGQESAQWRVLCGECSRG